MDSSPIQPHDIGHGHGLGNNNNSNNSGIVTSNGVDLNGALYVKVMTDEQLEILRTQISVYATLSQQLINLHKSISIFQDLSGVGLANLYCDPTVTAIGHKITARQRWTPTPVQLQILESIFDQGTGTPSKQKIKEIAAELSQHGHISETNVYNWFQNRRARSKRKQLNNAQNNAESEIEADVESPKDKMTKPEDLCYENQEISSSMHSVDPESGKMEPMFGTDGGSTSSQCPSQLAFYDSILQNPRVDHLNGKTEVPGSYYHFSLPEDYTSIP